MPFLHEGSSGSGNSNKVTITPTPLSLNDLKHVIASGGVNISSPSSRNSLNSQRSQRLSHSNNNSSPSHNNNNNNSSSSSAALIAQQQQKIAQRKLQMAKLLSNGSNGGGSSSSNSSAALALAAMNNFQNMGSSGTSRSSPLLPPSNHSNNNNNNNNNMMDRMSNSGNSDSMYVSSRRARSNNFTLKETFDLLKVWASPEMQWQMKHNFRNFRVWEAISYSMSELGHDRTAIQCKNRIQNLTSIFYRIKKSKQDYRTFNFPYYKLIGDVLDGKKAGSSLGSLGLHAPSVNAYGQGLNPADFQSSTNSSVSPTSQGNGSSGFAAHLALVEEYQSLINGQPDGYMSHQSDGRESPDNTDGMNVLSPEVSLSEGNSPVRVENQNQSRNGPSSSKLDNTDMSGVDDDGLLGMGGGDEELDDTEDFEDPIGEEDDMTENMESFSGGGGRGAKRPFSASFPNSYLKQNGGGLPPPPPSSSSANPMKRPRVSMMAALAAESVGGGEGGMSIGHYLGEMLDLERQWLDMERERAENERHMMMYMMQILQALVSPNGGADDDEEEENVGGGGNGGGGGGNSSSGNNVGGDGNGGVDDEINEEEVSTNEEEESIRDMIEREENGGEGEEEELEDEMTLEELSKTEQLSPTTSTPQQLPLPLASSNNLTNGEESE